MLFGNFPPPAKVVGVGTFAMLLIMIMLRKQKVVCAFFKLILFET